MKRSYHKKLSKEDKFGRKYYCCFYNHSKGLSKLKKENRRRERRKLKEEIEKRIKEVD